MAKRLVGADGPVVDMNGRTLSLLGADGKPETMTLIGALGHLADNYMAPQGQAFAAFLAVRIIRDSIDTPASHLADGAIGGHALLEEDDYKKVVTLVEAAYGDKAREYHGLRTSVLNALTDWLQTAEKVQVKTVGAES